MKRDKVTVVVNKYGGMINMLVDGDYDDQIYMIRLKQSNKSVRLYGDIEMVIGVSLEPGEELMNGKIVTKERFEPWISEDPLALLKMKNGNAAGRMEE